MAEDFNKINKAVIRRQDQLKKDTVEPDAELVGFTSKRTQIVELLRVNRNVRRILLN